MNCVYDFRMYMEFRVWASKINGPRKYVRVIGLEFLGREFLRILHPKQRGKVNGLLE